MTLVSVFQKVAKHLAGEALGQLVGFMAGLGASSVLHRFFVRKSVFNLWGAFSSRQAVDKDTLHVLEWIVSALIGFAVFSLVNWLFQRPEVRRLLGQKTKASEQQNSVGDT